MTVEQANQREPLLYDGQKLWSMDTMHTGQKGFTYGDGTQELLSAPTSGRPGGVTVDIKEPISRGERARLGKASDGTWEARRWRDG